MIRARAAVPLGRGVPVTGLDRERRGREKEFEDAGGGRHLTNDRRPSRRVATARDRSRPRFRSHTIEITRLEAKEPAEEETRRDRPEARRGARKRLSLHGDSQGPLIAASSPVAVPRHGGQISPACGLRWLLNRTNGRWWIGFPGSRSTSFSAASSAAQTNDRESRASELLRLRSASAPRRWMAVEPRHPPSSGSLRHRLRHRLRSRPSQVGSHRGRTQGQLPLRHLLRLLSTLSCECA